MEKSQIIYTLGEIQEIAVLQGCGLYILVTLKEISTSYLRAT